MFHPSSRRRRFFLAGIPSIGVFLLTGCQPTSLSPNGLSSKASAKGVPSLSAAKADPAADIPPAPFYSVAQYDDARDPAADLAATLSRAKSENKRVMLLVGGDWCPWCKRISNYMSTNEKIRDLVEKNFVVMKVTYPGEHAEAFLAAYPKCEAYPHLFVLDNQGQLLRSQGTGELEQGSGYDDDRFARFLTAASAKGG